MINKHYKDQIGPFIDRELPKELQHDIGEHLMQCGDCRREHDRIKMGSQLASRMERADASPDLWDQIDSKLDDGRSPHISMMPADRHFGIRNWAGYAAAAVLVTLLVGAAYFSLFRPQAGPDSQIAVSTADEAGAATAGAPSGDLIIAQAVPATPSASTSPSPSAELGSLPAWEIETIAGKPAVGAASSKDRLAVGDFLETDGASKARISVADIGNVEIAPNSRVKLIGTTANEHRLSLERGSLHARIVAPPRLFIVDTPSAVAVDLGCEYKLEVDDAGNSFLHVTSGFVALERDGRESIVPAGAMCLTRRGKGLGTPFSAETSKEFRAALERFDFADGGSQAVQGMLETREFYDMITLWHLLPSVSRLDREKVYDALAAYVEPPKTVTRAGILSLNKKMLEAWRVEVESAWFS
jgi:hypothetical protein